ncbi:LOW QUALITY PROTEIN: Kruppel-like factor 18 [Mus pahari]|uniref:LOW QUALITY PROTEIN: Kruppel-like factor 18 n=1 Tax=Mus pahari TaxID=10093 RepID=UPI000A30B063|nr:LOW QUALITY PROTEIN: Kruppel-like factor 18 [Mus pahari]
MFSFLQQLMNLKSSQAFCEVYIEMAENASASQPGPCNTQLSPLESSQLVSGQNTEMPTCKQTVMTSASCSIQDTACTQNSTANLGKVIDFHFGEPDETASVNQQDVSAEQKKSPEFPQLMQINSTPKTCLPSGEKTAVLDTRETLYNEGSWMRTLSPDKTLFIQTAVTCESQRIAFGIHQISLSGIRADQEPIVDHLLASVCDQTFRGELEITLRDDQVSYYSHMTTRNGGHLTLYGSQMVAPSCSQAPHPNQIITSFSEQNSFGDQQSNPAADKGIYGDQVMLPNGGYQVFCEPQMRANCDQTNDQMKSFRGQNVCKGQENLLRGEHSLSGYQTSDYRCDQGLIVNPQATSSIGGQPLSDFQIPTSNVDTTLHGSKRTRSSAEDNLDCPLETSPSSEETFFLGQMKTSVDQDVYPSQNGTLNIEESLDPRVTSLSNQAPYVGESSYPSGSPLIHKQPQKNSSASSLVQGPHPEMKLDLKPQSPVSQKNPHPLKYYSCTYKNCQKSYKSAQHLNDHMKKHTGEKAYACNKPGCTWKFSRLRDFKRHKQKHSGVRPYPCPMCNKDFARLEYLKQHVRHHIKVSPPTAT